MKQYKGSTVNNTGDTKDMPLVKIVKNIPAFKELPTN